MLSQKRYSTSVYSATALSFAALSRLAAMRAYRLQQHRGAYEAWNMQLDQTRRRFRDNVEKGTDEYHCTKTL